MKLQTSVVVLALLCVGFLFGCAAQTPQSAPTPKPIETIATRTALPAPTGGNSTVSIDAALLESVNKFSDTASHKAINQALLNLSRTSRRITANDLSPEFRAYWQDRWQKKYPDADLDTILAEVSTDPSVVLAGRDANTGNRWVTQIRPQTECGNAIAFACWISDSPENIIEINPMALNPPGWNNPRTLVELGLVKEMTALQIYSQLYFKGKVQDPTDVTIATENLSHAIEGAMAKQLVDAADQSIYLSQINADRFSMQDCCQE